MHVRTNPFQFAPQNKLSYKLELCWFQDVISRLSALKYGCCGNNGIDFNFSGVSWIKPEA
ncbi:hypothetical protein KAS14_06215 [Candidatus Bathyarchaeota archaeon]|nr:hypothetical protein [Candidatus Bathyarchaeota archaeon]